MAEQTDTQIFNRADQISTESQPGGNTKTRVGGLFRDVWETLVARLATKANATEVTSALAAKANLSDVNTALNAKANAADVNTALAGKADASALTTLASVVATKPDEQDITDAVTAEATARAAADAALLQQIEALPSGDYLPLEGNSLASPIAGDVFLEGDKKLVFLEKIIDETVQLPPYSVYTDYYLTNNGKYKIILTLEESLPSDGSFLAFYVYGGGAFLFSSTNSTPNNVAPQVIEQDVTIEDYSSYYFQFGGNGSGAGRMKVEVYYLAELNLEQLKPQDLGLLAKTTTQQMADNGQGGAFGVGESIIYDFENASQKLFGIKTQGYYFYLDGSYYNNNQWGFKSNVNFEGNLIYGNNWAIDPSGYFSGRASIADFSTNSDYANSSNTAYSSNYSENANTANSATYANQAASAYNADVAYDLFIGDVANWWMTTYWDGAIGAIQIRKNYQTEFGLVYEDKIWIDNSFNVIADKLRTADSGYSDPTVSAPSKAALTDSSTLADVLNYLASIHNALKSKNIIST